jgi:Zn-dependent membrane protease YugP
MFWYDTTYILVLIGALISFIASINVNSTYKRYSKVGNCRGITSQQAAEAILHSAGIYDVRIERIRGNLTDHYSPNEKVLRLSDSVYGSTSVAAIGVAANIGSKLSWPLILLGLILGSYGLAEIGVLLFIFVVIFQLITLPVEFNASSRALKVLNQQNMLFGDEMTGARKVLTAAALTYVAALFSAVLQLLRLILLTQGGGRRRR